MWVAAVREWLSAIDVDRLSDRERLDLVADLERVKHTAAATQTRATHALRRSREASRPQDAVRSIGSEVALARRQSPTLGDRFVGVARALVDEMPFTMQALDAGVCSERHAEVMVQATSILTVEHRAEVDRRVGPLLGRLGVRGAERAGRRVAQELDVGHSYVSRPPPLLGWGATPPKPNPGTAPSSAASPRHAPALSNASTPRRSDHQRVPAHRDPDRARRRVLSRARVRLNHVRATAHLERSLRRLLTWAAVLPGRHLGRAVCAECAAPP